MNLLEKLNWANSTIENQLTFGMSPFGAALARETRVHGVLVEAIETIDKIKAVLPINCSPLAKQILAILNEDN